MIRDEKTYSTAVHVLTFGRFISIPTTALAVLELSGFFSPLDVSVLEFFYDFKRNILPRLLEAPLPRLCS